MRIEMSVGGVNILLNESNINTFVVTSCGDVTPIAVNIDSHNWNAEIRTTRMNAFEANDGVGCDIVKLEAVRADGTNMRCEIERASTLGAMDISETIDSLGKRFVAECLFEAVIEANKRDEYNNIALRGAISDFLGKSEFSAALIDEIVDPSGN